MQETSTSTKTQTSESGGPCKVVGGVFTSKNGGDVEVDTDNPMSAPGGVQMTDYGAAFGPLELIAYPGSVATIGGLEFVEEKGFFDGLFGSDSSGGLFGAAGLIAATEYDDRVERRDALKAIGALGGVAMFSSPAKADTSTRTQAQFSLTENPKGVRIRVLDRINQYLPTDKRYYTYVNSAEYSQFSAANSDSYGDILPELLGTVVVGPEGSGGSLLDRLTSDKERTYEGLTLTNSDGSIVSDVKDKDAGTELTVTENDVIVEAAQNAGAEETMLAINGTSIPHSHESKSDSVGRYLFQDGGIRYIVGSNPPTGQTATLSLYVGHVTEILDDAGRWS